MIAAAARAPNPAKGSIEARNPDPEIGDANLILERARRPADGRCRLLRDEHMADKSPEALYAERKDQNVAQQPVDHEAEGDRPRSPPHCNDRANKRDDPQSHRHERNDYAPGDIWSDGI
jgi:hypothetical protein